MYGRGKVYYRENRLSLTKLEDVAGRFKAVLRKNSPIMFSTGGEDI